MELSKDRASLRKNGRNLSSLLIRLRLSMNVATDSKRIPLLALADAEKWLRYALMVFAISLLTYVFRLTFFTLPWLIALSVLFLAITAFRFYSYKSPYKRLRQIGEAIRKVMVTAGHLSDDQSRVAGR